MAEKETGNRSKLPGRAAVGAKEMASEQPGLLEKLPPQESGKNRQKPQPSEST